MHLSPLPGLADFTIMMEWSVADTGSGAFLTPGSGSGIRNSGYKKRYDNKFCFTPLSFVAVFGSGMGKNQDPRSGINIWDPQHRWNVRQKVAIDTVCTLWYIRYLLRGREYRVYQYCIYYSTCCCGGEWRTEETKTGG